MKFLWVLPFVIFLFILSSFLSTSFLKNSLFWFDDDDKYLTKAERSVNKVLYQTSQSIEKKYKIKPGGTGISMPGGIVRNLGLAYHLRKELSKEQLRELTVLFAEELLHQINSNEDIQPFLVKRPFTIENVSIIIHNHDKKGFSLYDPEISVSHLADGVIEYKTDDPEDEFKYKNRYEETYEQALQLIQKKN